MKARVDYARLYSLIEPTAAALISISTAVKESGFDPKIVELIKIRASQMNGCAFCLNMHVAEARAGGEREERMHLLAAWRESTFFTPRERAALAWTEALTRLDQGAVSDEVYAIASAEFDEAELAQLTSAILAINSWNRIAVSYRFQHPGRP
ncbi:MAG TPA: carboxymuconolactone decarboxylase family protein [Aliidongia sp.]|uniref:carboxymuconolactone decarboxylase family protein n=1 Tax=Aliidongia sp. TaxID=1914230 RepID=UPI002DDD84BC|nr:carboxymuconolactone decarboxylase family protein [Aliidongia sp.]HEV2677943.1 carboxymuconolactone decarboxylase family protein [Aliidongia sp.]